MPRAARSPPREQPGAGRGDGSLARVGDRLVRFPLFPLRLVLLPSEVVPLHIFVERYKLMIGECLDDHSEFGIVWFSEQGIREVGCTAAVTRVLERTDDGRMNVLVEGGRPFRVLRRIDELPYPAGDVELLDDGDPGPVDPQVSSEARERYADLVARVTDSRPDEGKLAGLDAYRMAARVDFSAAHKQALLESRAEEERLRTVAGLFAATLKRLDYIDRTAEVAKANGRVPR